MKRLLLWLALLAPASAQPNSNAPAITLEAKSALGDVVRFGRPFQSVVEISVQDPALTMECRLLLEENTRWEASSQTPVKLSPGLQRVSLPYLSASYNPQVKLDGLPAGVPVTATVTPSIAMDHDFLILNVTPHGNRFSYLAGYKSLLKRKQGEVRTTHPDNLDLLPVDWWAYLGMDAVLLHDIPNLKLSDEVEQALLGYVQAGGTLVLVSNLDPHEYRNTAFEPLLPLAPRASGELLSGKLAADASVRLREGEQPLLLRRHHGNGWIYQVTAPVENAELLGASLTSKLWTEVLNEERTSAFRRVTFDPSGLLELLPELPPPATTAMAWYLALYVLVAVPGIYVYLRRKDQVLRLILVIPATALAFSAGAYYFNSLGRGDQLVLREYTFAWLISGQTRLTCDSMAALFSPTPARYSVEMKADTFVRPQPEPGRSAERHTLSCQGRKLLFENERLAQWGVSRWRGLALRELPGTIELRSQRQQGVLQVRIDNRSGLELTRALLIGDNLACSFPASLPPGRHTWQQPTATHYTLDQYLNDPALALESHDSSVLRNLIEAARVGRPALLGWSEAELFRTFMPSGLQPKQFRRTLLLVTEEAP